MSVRKYEENSYIPSDTTQSPGRFVCTAGVMRQVLDSGFMFHVYSWMFTKEQ